MSENTPVTFDANALRQRVADTVKTTFGMLIPEEQWKAMVEREVKAYFEEEAMWSIIEQPKGNRYDSPTFEHVTRKITPFRVAVWEAVHVVVKPMLHELLNEDSIKAQIHHHNGYIPTSATIGEKLKPILESLVPQMANEMFKLPFAMMMQQTTGMLEQKLESLKTR